MKSYENLKTQVEELLARRGGNKADLLRMATADPESEKSKFYKFLNGQSIPQADALLEWLDRLGFTITPPDEKLEGFELVNMVEAKAGAGASLETSDRTLGQYAFRESFMRREGLHADKCVLMRVIGDSMEPLIRDGDTILVDESEAGKVLKDNQISVIGVDEELMVKRVIKIPKGWRLHSENKEKGDVDITGEDLNSLRVYGRVRWFGRVV